MSEDDPTTDDSDDSAIDDGDDGRIRALDQRTVQQIAAGEVVERPASVVKELVENSLDAGASRVVVAVESGGTDGIRVRDDGRGMTESEVRLAVQEHTTSKIRDVDDLEGGVGTLGFRGEALHTIGAVSRTTIRTRAADADSAGTELRIEGGAVAEVKPTGCPTGTIVEVEDLFYNTPARRKFLKTEATEFDHVNTVVTQYALANPDVAMKLEHDGREVFATEGRGSLEAAVLSVYGREVAESMTAVESTPETDSVEAVEGLASHPETTRSTREYLSTFVNGRYVTASVLREAVLDAYGGQLAADRYPFAVLFLSVPSDAVDVNVHPRKMEVRFDEEREVREAVERAVGDALLEEGLIRSSAPRGRSAPDETAVRPGGDAGGDAGGTTGDDGGDVDRATSNAGDDYATAGGDAADAVDASAADETTPSTPEVTFDAVDDASSDATPGRAADRPAPGANRNAGSAEATPGAGGGTASSIDTESDGPGTAEDDGPSPTAEDDGSSPTAEDDGSSPTAEDDGPSPTAEDDGPSPTAEDDGSSSATGADGPSQADARSADLARAVTGPTTQRTLDGDAVDMAPEFDQLPQMRVLGQLFDTYVVAETGEGLVLIDQHAADERVNYERLQEAVAGDTTTQALADPVELELTAREAALFEEYVDALAQVGFHAGRTDERTVEVRTVPAVFDETLDPSLLRDVLTAFVTGEDEDGQSTVDAVANSLLADLACYPSITGNTSLREGSVVDLLAALDDCQNPYACPHGRPVIIEFDRDEIEDRFERDYPGHAGRRHE